MMDPVLQSPQSPDEALDWLREGNLRFVEDRPLHPNRGAERKMTVAQLQTPFATIVGCSDSRVPAEIVFDQGLGDLFIVRTAGQVMADASIGSIEFSVAILGVKLIVVLGHERCGAVRGALSWDPLPGQIERLVNQIRPAVREYIGREEYWEEACHANIRAEVARLRDCEPVLAPAYREAKIKIVGAYYQLETGKIELME